MSAYRLLQRGLCYEPSNADLQEALQQILAEMARPEAVSRCHSLWPRANEDLKASHLFSRQFLGIGVGDSDTQELADQARSWERQTQEQYLGPLWPDTIHEPLSGRKLRWAIFLLIWLTTQWGGSYSQYSATTTKSA